MRSALLDRRFGFEGAIDCAPQTSAFGAEPTSRIVRHRRKSPKRRPINGDHRRLRHTCILYSEWRSDSCDLRGCVRMTQHPTAPEGMLMSRAYNVVDADGHILEPLDLWDHYI